jgi:hypothetical protein
MESSVRIMCAATVCVALAASCAAETLAPALAAAVRRGDAAACRGALDALLDAAEKMAGAGDVGARWQTLRQSRGYTLALAQAELVRATGEEGVARILSDAAGRSFVSAFLSDREWLESYLASGPVPEAAAAGLATLRDLWLADREADAPKYRRIATAVALAFNTEPQSRRLQGVTAREKNPLTALARYTFFKESQKAGRLRPLFDNLAVWELRWVVCAPVENEALAWLQRNVNLPMDQFDDACWIPRYRGVNDFGNTIQGPLFYAPSRGHCNWAEDVALHGGVCGSLSTFGAFNAIAHGLPAMPKGQPGHCAYAFRVAPGEWVPAFGGPDGGAAYHFWKDTFSSVWLADDAFADAGRMLESMRLAWQARRAAARGDAAAARAVYGLATAAQPLNWAVWQERIDACLADRGALGKAEWQALADGLLGGMAKHPAPLCELLAQVDEKALWPQLDAGERRALCLRVHDTVAANHRPGWTPWNMPEALLPRQLKGLGAQAEPGAFFGDVLTAYCRHPHEYFLGQLIDWGSQNLTKTPAGKEQFFAALTTALTSGAKLDEKLRRNMLNSAIRATEEARSVGGFQLLSEAAAALSTAEGALQLEVPEAGKLVSADGLLYLSGFDGYDNPVNHRDVLREAGGFFHGQPSKDSKDARPWAVVQLSATCKLTGLAIANRLSNQGRCTALRVFASTDERTWTPIATTDAFKQQWKVDLRDQKIRARWIKVENATPNSDAFHLRNICVYGEAES